MSRTFSEEFITIRVVLGEIAEDALEAQFDMVSAVQDAAYAIVDSRWRDLPSAVEHERGVEYEVFELCRDDGEIEEIDGKAVWSIGFHSGSQLPVQPLREMRNLVMAAYEEAAKAAGLPVRFIDVQRQKVFQVTETDTVDLDAESTGA